MTDRTKLASFMIDVSISHPQLDVNVQSFLTTAFADTDGLCDGVNVFQVMSESVASQHYG